MKHLEVKNELGQFEDLECPVTRAFAEEAQALGHGEISDTGLFIAVYPYYGTGYCQRKLYEIEDIYTDDSMKLTHIEKLVKEYFEEN